MGSTCMGSGFPYCRCLKLGLYFTAEGAETAKREIYLNYNQVVFGQQLTEQVTLGGILD